MDKKLFSTDFISKFADSCSLVMAIASQGLHFGFIT